MQLLEQRDAETAIRVGDVYALLVYFHAQQKAWPQAQALVEAMRARGIQVDPFVDAALVKSIYVRSKGFAPWHIKTRHSLHTRPPHRFRKDWRRRGKGWRVAAELRRT